MFVCACVVRVFVCVRVYVRVGCMWGVCKQKQMNIAGYGPSLSDVEKQIAAQNILHQEMEAYSPQLDPSNMVTSEAITLSQLGWTPPTW